MPKPFADLAEGGLKRAADVEITRVVKPKHGSAVSPSPFWTDDPRDRREERAARYLREMTVETSTNNPDKKPEYRVLEATPMGTFAEAMKHIYESGKMDALTFSERQQKYKEFIDAFSHTTPEDIAGQLLAGAAKALYIGENGKIFLNDALHYVATTFYKASPSWVSGKYDEDLYDLGEQRAKGAELIRHLQTRFSWFETLERYELADGTDYDKLWSTPGASDLKDEIARLVTSFVTTPGARAREIYSQLRVLPEVIPTPALFPGASGALFPEPGLESKWSCNGPASFELEKNGQQLPDTRFTTHRFLSIFNRPQRFRAFLLPLTEITDESSEGDVQLWLHECGCTGNERASVHGQILSGVNFSTMTAFDFQKHCGFAKPRAKALHAAMKAQTLHTAIGIANDRAIENFTNAYNTPRWKAEIMLLHALSDECPYGDTVNDVISSYWNLDTRAHERAIDAVLAGVTPIEREQGLLPPFFHQLELRRVTAFFPRFPSIVSSILNDSTIGLQTIADMQVGPQSTDIMKMLAIYHPGRKERNERCFEFWINPELLELISDWYFNCALTATVPAQQPLLLKDWPCIEIPRSERWFQSLLGYKVSIEPAGGSAVTPTYKDIVPLQALTTWDLNDYDAYEFDNVSTFLHAVFDPLRIHNKGEPVAQDAVGLIYQGLLDALDELDDDATRLSDALKTPLVEEWVLNEYTADRDDCRYNTYLFLQSEPFIVFCRTTANRGDINPIDTARWAIAKFQSYHIEKTTINTKICQKLKAIWESTEQARRSAKSNEDVLVIHRKAIKTWFDKTLHTLFNWHHTDDSAREDQLWAGHLLYGDGQGSSETGIYSVESTVGELCLCLEEYSYNIEPTAFREASGQTIYEVYTNDEVYNYRMLKPYNDTDDINRGNRLDFTLPDTRTTVHFSRKGHRVESRPDTWCVRFHTPVHWDSDPDHHPFQDWVKVNNEFGKHFLNIVLPQPHPELRKHAAVLILDEEISQADIIEGVADCTIWDHVKENDTFWTSVITTQFEDRRNRRKGFDRFMDATLKTIIQQVRKSIITPMFVEVAKETLHLQNVRNGNVYMLASFTDLAL